MHSSEPLVPEQSAFVFELAIERPKIHKPLDVDQIPAEFIKSEARIISYEIHTQIISIWNKKEMPKEWKGPYL